LIKKEKYRDFKSCIICESNRQKIIHKYPENFYDENAFIKHSWDGNLGLSLNIVKCLNCGFIFQNPCINSKSLEHFYPTEIIPEYLDINKQLLSKKYDFIINNVIRKLNKKNNIKSIIDVGARYGLLATKLNLHGFSTLSIEYNSKCVSLAKKSGVKNIYEGTIDNIETILEDNNFKSANIIILCDVIEHLINPVNDFKIISKIQCSGDRVLITTPNIGSLGYRLFRKYWYYIHGQHTLYFNDNSIKKFANLFGYEIEVLHKIPYFKNVKIIFPNLVKLFKHIIEINFNNKKSNNKTWFAENRPSLFDTMTVVLKKI
jgi:2-polyprenyl-3-methyl-5-hydroxy-6-metoxy-1,4-benzoquinol methylase